MKARLKVGYSFTFEKAHITVRYRKLVLKVLKRGGFEGFEGFNSEFI